MSAQKTFQLIIAKVNEQLYNGAAESITVPGSEGELTLLAHHEALISILKAGTITVRGGATGLQQFSITNGILEVSNNQLTVLVS